MQPGSNPAFKKPARRSRGLAFLGECFVARRQPAVGGAARGVVMRLARQRAEAAAVAIAESERGTPQNRVDLGGDFAGGAHREPARDAASFRTDGDESGRSIKVNSCRSGSPESRRPKKPLFREPTYFGSAARVRIVSLDARNSAA